MIYCLYTTIDITETKQRHGGDFVPRCQQQNFDTVLQTIGLCGNVYFDHSPKKITASMFGQKNKSIWHFEWRMEIEELFTKDGNHVAILEEVFQYVPVILNLTENAKIEKPMFEVGKNIAFSFK